MFLCADPVPGEWRFTPGFALAFLPAGATSPCSVGRTTSRHVAPPYDVKSRAYARDFAEVKRLGGAGAPTASTPEQTEIARFWVNSAPLMGNRIARTVAEDRHRGMRRSVGLLALANRALADRLQLELCHEVPRPLLAADHGGFHFRHATQVVLRHGRRLARDPTRHFLRPVHHGQHGGHHGAYRGRWEGSVRAGDEGREVLALLHP